MLANNCVDSTQGNGAGNPKALQYLNFSISDPAQKRVKDRLSRLRISDEVAALNLEFIPDIYELEIDPYTHEVLSAPHLEELGWDFTRFTKEPRHALASLKLCGENGVWQNKILKPDAKRSGQYFARKGIGDVPYVPNIPNGIVWKNACKVSRACEISWLGCVENGGSFWEWVQDWKQIPLIATEGAEKALSVISQGYIALSLYGCLCGQKDGKIKPELLPYVEGRRIYIAFDQDPKGSKGAKSVYQGIKNIGFALKTHAKAHVSIVEWNGEYGKGIDDLIATDPVLFELAIAAAKSYDRWTLKRFFSIDDSLVSLRLNTPNLTEAIPEVPNHRTIFIKSPKKTFKTQVIAKWIAPFLSQGGKVIVPVHREQLAKALANAMGIEYRTELTKEGKLFGYSLCIDSLHPKANPSFNVENWGECWVILDELDQVAWHTLNSDTCNFNRPAILNSFVELLNVADKRICASADMNKACIDWINKSLEVPESKPYIIVNDYKHPPRQCYTYDKPEKMMAVIIDSIENGRKIIIHTGGQRDKSKWGTRNLEKELNFLFPDIKILRIDRNSVSEVGHPALGIMGNINEALPNYDVVICSPTVETGISININHFDAVFCFASGSQTVDAIGQTLERVRADIPRHIWAEEHVNWNLIGNGSTSPYSLTQGQKKVSATNKKLLADLGKADQYASLEMGETGIQTNHLNTWAIFAAHHNMGFRNYRESIYELLEANSFEIIPTEVTATEQQLEEVKESIKASAKAGHREYCEKVAKAPIITDKDEYKALRDKRAKTEQERLSADATAIANKYATETIDPELVNKDSNYGWYSALRLHYYLTIGNQFVKGRDQDKVEALAKETGQIFTPDFNKACLSSKVEALKRLGIVQFLNGDRQFTAEDPDLVEWHKTICAHARDIKTYIGITVNQNPEAKNNSPIDILKRFLKKLDINLECIGKQTWGSQSKVFRITSLDPDGRAAIFDRWLTRDTQATQDKMEDKCSTKSNSLERYKYLDNSSNGVQNITKCTASESMEIIPGSIIELAFNGSRHLVSAINGQTVVSRPVEGGETTLTHIDWVRLIA
jgi:hypothetical protein